MDTLTRLAEQLGQQLAALSAQVATAESCTGGGIAEAITRIAGCSRWFEAGYVTYSNAQKTAQLAVPSALLAQYGAVSREVVEAMAAGAQQASAARFSVAVTGIAGPAGAEPGKPVGTVWLAWRDAQQSYAHCYGFQGDRHAIRQQSIEAALKGLLALCMGTAPVAPSIRQSSE